MFRCRHMCGLTKLFRMKNKRIRETRQVGEIFNSVCMYKIYLMTGKTWLQSNLPHGRLASVFL